MIDETEHRPEWVVEAHVLLTRLIAFDVGLPDGTRMTGAQKDSWDQIILKAKELADG